MPDDVVDERWGDEGSEPSEEDAAPAHDDIMKRLLDYQRSLREGASPAEATEAVQRSAEERDRLEPPSADAAAEPLSQEPSAERTLEEPAPPPQPAPGPVTTPAPTPEPPSAPTPPTPEAVESAAREGEDSSGEDLEDRVAHLEDRLDRLGSRLAELREGFQEMGVAADERLADLGQNAEPAGTDHDPEIDEGTP